MHLQRSSQDVRQDSHFQHPPPQIQQHRQPQPPPSVEVNEMEPTIQQGVIQCPAQGRTQITTIGVRPKEAVQSIKVQQTSAALPDQNHNRGNRMSDPRGNGRDRLPGREENPSYSDFVMNSIHGSRPFS